MRAGEIVETGATETFYTGPAHDYSKQLYSTRPAGSAGFHPPGEAL
jgi:ABC-type dipeptide/oligopeptide/nickel transport system ATPase component